MTSFLATLQGDLLKSGVLLSVTTRLSPAYSSASNGTAEVTIQITRGIYRTLKVQLEKRIGRHQDRQ